MYIYVYATYITGLWAPTVSMYIVGACVCVCVRHDTHTSCVPPIRTGLRALVCVRETHTLCMWHRHIVSVPPIRTGVPKVSMYIVCGLRVCVCVCVYPYCFMSSNDVHVHSVSVCVCVCERESMCVCVCTRTGLLAATMRRVLRVCVYQNWFTSSKWCVCVCVCVPKPLYGQQRWAHIVGVYVHVCVCMKENTHTCKL